MHLKELWLCNDNDIYALFQSFPANENGFMNEAKDMPRDIFKQWVQKSEQAAMGIGLPAWKVPQTTYVLFNDDNKAVGVFKLRHYLNENVRNGSGHIGFGIGAAFRRQGYATAGLKLCLEKAKERGIDLAYLSCYKYNTGSLKAMLNCGAYIDHEDEQEYYTRIPLK